MFIVQKNRNNATIKRKLFPILVAKIQEEKMKEWVKCYTSDVLINCCVCKRWLKIGDIQPIISSWKFIINRNCVKIHMLDGGKLWIQIQYYQHC